jgi:hypothetical protein
MAQADPTSSKLETGEIYATAKRAERKTTLRKIPVGPEMQIIGTILPYSAYESRIGSCRDVKASLP